MILLSWSRTWNGDVQAAVGDPLWLAAVAQRPGRHERPRPYSSASMASMVSAKRSKVCSAASGFVRSMPAFCSRISG